MKLLAIAFFVTLGVGMTGLRWWDNEHPCEALCRSQGLHVRYKCVHPDMVACMCYEPGDVKVDP